MSLFTRRLAMIIVCDESGSMNTDINGTDVTPWDELCSIVKIISDQWRRQAFLDSWAIHW